MSQAVSLTLTDDTAAELLRKTLEYVMISGPIFGSPLGLPDDQNCSVPFSCKVEAQAHPLPSLGPGSSVHVTTAVTACFCQN